MQQKSKVIGFVHGIGDGFTNDDKLAIAAWAGKQGCTAKFFDYSKLLDETHLLAHPFFGWLPVVRAFRKAGFNDYVNDVMGWAMSPAKRVRIERSLALWVDHYKVGLLIGHSLGSVMVEGALRLDGVTGIPRHMPTVWLLGSPLEFATMRFISGYRRDGAWAVNTKDCMYVSATDDPITRYGSTQFAPIDWQQKTVTGGHGLMNYLRQLTDDLPRQS
jgi:hypothetical protein